MNVEDAFIVHFSHKQIKFTKTEQDLYIFKPKIKKSTKAHVLMVNTVDKNKAFFTYQQFKKAKKARELHHAL